MRFLFLLVLMLSPLVSFSQDEETSINEETNEAIENDEDITENPENSEATPAVSKVIRHTPNPNKWRIGDVSRYLDNYARQTEVQVFTAQDLAVSGLYLPENTGKPQGGVLILHDNEQHAHWPQTVAPLREYLPDYGWNTLSLFMIKGLSVLYQKERNRFLLRFKVKQHLTTPPVIQQTLPTPRMQNKLKLQKKKWPMKQTSLKTY